MKKPKNLFDHLTAIRTTKGSNYYDSLTEKEKKGFNHWSILHGLSQDINLTQLVAFLWTDGYYDSIPSNLFYKLLVDLVPQTNSRLYWIKKSKKSNNKLIEYISKWYSISSREAEGYLNIFMESDGGIEEIANILEGSGLTDKEAEEILTNVDNNHE